MASKDDGEKVYGRSEQIDILLDGLAVSVDKAYFGDSAISIAVQHTVALQAVLAALKLRRARDRAVARELLRLSRAMETSPNPVNQIRLALRDMAWMLDQHAEDTAESEQ